MKAIWLLAIVPVLLAQPEITNAHFETRAFSGDLASQIRAAGPAWFGYAAHSTPGDHNSCCWNNGNQCGCNLENESRQVTGTRPNTPVRLEGSGEVAVLFRVVNNDVQKVRVYSTSCPLDAGALQFVWLTGVPAKTSLAFLEKVALAHTSDHVLDGAIMAVAQHDDPEADSILERLTRPDRAENVREKAIFWMGASRGARGVTGLKHILATDSSDKTRDKAIFALSINKQPEALETIVSAAKNDSSAHVRSQAIFWLSQKAGQRAVAAITDAVDNDPDTAVKEKAVFALSQLPKDEGVTKLIEVARNNKNPRVRKQAFFWLGQSGNPRALAFIEQVLTK
jgi:HEAT repeat protein